MNLISSADAREFVDEPRIENDGISTAGLQVAPASVLKKLGSVQRKLAASMKT